MVRSRIAGTLRSAEDSEIRTRPATRMTVADVLGGSALPIPCRGRQRSRRRRTRNCGPQTPTFASTRERYPHLPLCDQRYGLAGDLLPSQTTAPIFAAEAGRGR